jgi:hypothetical protein
MAVDFDRLLRTIAIVWLSRQRPHSSERCKQPDIGGEGGAVELRLQPTAAPEECRITPGDRTGQSRT